MTLIKTDSTITDISGKLGGTYFQRDNSGLHMKASPRQIAKGAASESAWPRRWYGSHKKEERHHADEPPEEFPIPKEHCTTAIFSLETLWATRALVAGIVEILDESSMLRFYGQSPDIYTWISVWLRDNWGRLKPPPLFGQDAAERMMFKTWYKYKVIYNWSSDQALGAAKFDFAEWCKLEIATSIEPLFGFWSSALAAGLYHCAEHWLEEKSGFITFNRGRCLIEGIKELHLGGGGNEPMMKWASLYGRISKKIFTFIVLDDVPFKTFRWNRDPFEPAYVRNYIHFDGMYTTQAPSILGTGLYNWTTAAVRHRGLAYIGTGGLLYLNASESQIEYWSVPVGWRNPDPTMLTWPNVFEDYFQYPGHAEDPL